MPRTAHHVTRAVITVTRPGWASLSRAGLSRGQALLSRAAVTDPAYHSYTTLSFKPHHHYPRIRPLSITFLTQPPLLLFKTDYGPFCPPHFPGPILVLSLIRVKYITGICERCTHICWLILLFRGPPPPLRNTVGQQSQPGAASRGTLSHLLD